MNFIESNLTEEQKEEILQDIAWQYLKDMAIEKKQSEYEESFKQEREQELREIYVEKY